MEIKYKQKEVLCMKTSKKFLWILVAVVVFIGATFPSLGTEVQATTYEKAIFPAPNLYLTQIAYESYSHGEQNAIDISPGGNVFAPFTGKIVQKDANWGFVLLQSNNKVYYSDGTLDYMTVGFMHDSNITDLSVGQTINQGQDFYQAGGMGGGNPNAYGVHVHITVLKGKVDFINPYGNGNVYAYKAFFVNTNKTRISKAGIVEYGNTVNYGAPTNYDGLWKTTTSSVETDNTSSLIKSTYPSSCKIKITKDSTKIRNMPCSEKTDKNAKTLEVAAKNTQYQAYELIKNSEDNLWYKIKTKSGTTGYVFAGNTSYVSQITDDIKAYDISVPANHTYGKSYGLKGSVSSTYNQLTSTSVYIYPGNSTSGTAETGASDSVTNNSYNFGGSTIDNKTLFNKLSSGTHTYVVKASYKNYYAKSGTTLGTNTGTKTVYTTSFTVSSNGSGSTTTSNEPTKILYPTSGSVVKLASGVGNNMYLDFACTNTNVQIYQNCDGHENPDFVKSQYFKLTHIGDGWYTIVNTGTGKAVDVYNASAAVGTNVWQYELNKSDAQLFRFYDAGSGYCYIKSKLGCYLDVANGTNANNTNVQMYTFNGSNAQKWKLIDHTHTLSSKTAKKATTSSDGETQKHCSICGLVTSKSKIYKIASVELSDTSYTYDGEAKKPSVIVKNSNGDTIKKATNYSIKYSSGRKNIGIYTVTITFRGKYSGKTELTFKIKPKKPTLKLSSTSSGKATFSWSDVTGESGYEVYYSTKITGNFTKLNTYKANVTSGSKSNLTSGKRYYFRVRAFTQTANGTVYSSWSTVKNIKIK
jgi:hypothetical protein